MRKIVSRASGVRLSRSCQPACSKWTMRPRLAIIVLMPANPRRSTYDCMTGLMRDKRSELQPTDSGEWIVSVMELPHEENPDHGRNRVAIGRFRLFTKFATVLEREIRILKEQNDGDDRRVRDDTGLRSIVFSKA